MLHSSIVQGVAGISGRGAQTTLNGINDLGHVIGVYTHSGGLDQAFWYDGTTFTNLTPPIPYHVQSMGSDINNLGQMIVGGSDSSGNGVSYLYDGSSYDPVRKHIVENPPEQE
jgi:probable HAF family extracellular repeat protein